jgi:hypothetical protein
VARQKEGRRVLDKPEAIRQRLRARFARGPSGEGRVGVVLNGSAQELQALGVIVAPE